MRERFLKGPRVMALFGEHFPDATFVQVGSNDGCKHDPLNTVRVTRRWSGVMVEPVPYVFQRLEENFGDEPRIILENVAVAAVSGKMPFFYVEKSVGNHGLPSWYDELGSFNKDVVLKHSTHIPDLESRLVQTEVECITFTELCERNSIDVVDLVHMDTEGYDFELIKSFDFERFMPRLMVYEHKHLNEADRLACQQLLRDRGYILFEERADTWCLCVASSTPENNAFVDDARKIAKFS